MPLNICKEGRSHVKKKGKKVIGTKENLFLGVCFVLFFGSSTVSAFCIMLDCKY